MIVNKLLVSLLAALLMTVTGAKIEAECSACLIVASALQNRLNNEKTRNHLDLRHRVDSKGKLYGKMIHYKKSELRAVELTNKICEEFESYVLGRKPDVPEVYWVKYDSTMKDVVFGSDGERTSENSIFRSFCIDLFDHYDDDITYAITREKFDIMGVEGPLCAEITKSCSYEDIVKGNDSKTAQKIEL